MSTKGRYGLRVMMELGARFGRGPVLAEAIAERQGISSKYLRVLTAGLRAAGLIGSTRGRAGGYRLTRKPSEISALEVVRALEGPTTPVACVADASACGRSNGCVARDLWCEVAVAVDAVLAGTTLERLVAQQQARVETQGMYHI